MHNLRFAEAQVHVQSAEHEKNTGVTAGNKIKDLLLFYTDISIPQ